MRNRILFLLAFLGAASAGFAAGDTNSVSLAGIPAAAQKAIQAQLGDGKLDSVDKEIENGEVTYDVELTTTSNQQRGFTVAADGSLVSVEVTLADAPPVAQKTIKSVLGGGTLNSIDKVLDDAEGMYDIEMTARDGRDKAFTVAADGTLLSLELALEETPQAVQAGIKKQTGDARIIDVTKMFDEDGITYDVDMLTKDNQEKSFTVAADGKLVSIQVTLAETAPAARKTIESRIGDGKILRIDKSFEETKGVLPYEVQGKKDGKPFDFSVGPKGKFLGMDE